MLTHWTLPWGENAQAKLSVGWLLPESPDDEDETLIQGFDKGFPAVCLKHDGSENQDGDDCDSKNPECCSMIQLYGNNGSATDLLQLSNQPMTLQNLFRQNRSVKKGVFSSFRDISECEKVPATSETGGELRLRPLEGLRRIPTLQRSSP